MNGVTLSELYQTTKLILGRGGTLGAGLDWVDQVLPRFTDACRNAVCNSDEGALADWRKWLQNDVQSIRDAGESDIYEWRKAWLETLIASADALARGEAYSDANRRQDLAQTLSSHPPAPLAAFSTGFWRDYVDYLCNTREAPGEPASVAAFPLVLSEKMIVDGDVMDVVVAEFRATKVAYGEGQCYLAPEQVAVRCLDAEFATTFRHAVAEMRRIVGQTEAPAARIEILTRRPEHEVFVQKLVLRGPSGGGALAAALFGLCPPDNRAEAKSGLKALTGSGPLAISFALTASDTPPDGKCHAVGGALEKVRGCARAGIGQLIVADEQASQVSFYGNLNSVSIVGSELVADALALSKAWSEPERPFVVPTLTEDGGVLGLDSPLYIDRKSDQSFKDALAQRPMIVLVKGARQIGKTSLLVRGVEEMRCRHIGIVYMDLQSLGRETLLTQRDFFLGLSTIFARELKLPVTLHEMYDDRDGPNKNFENFLFKYALGAPLVWFMDSVDRLFDFGYYTDVFSLMRSWHNRRPVVAELSNLTLVLSYATETHLMIRDSYQSPFNVGIKVELADFGREQIAELNGRLGKPLVSELEIIDFHRLVGGHPHLVCRGLAWMAQERTDLIAFASRSSLDSGPLGTHLRHLLALTQNEEHLAVVQDVLAGQKCANDNAFLHLRSAGVLIGDDCTSARMRCQIYADYLRRHLMPAAGHSKNGRRGLFDFLRSGGGR